jgi:hypothetical protein
MEWVPGDNPTGESLPSCGVAGATAPRLGCHPSAVFHSALQKQPGFPKAEPPGRLFLPASTRPSREPRRSLPVAPPLANGGATGRLRGSDGGTPAVLARGREGRTRASLALHFPLSLTDLGGGVRWELAMVPAVLGRSAGDRVGPAWAVPAGARLAGSGSCLPDSPRSPPAFPPKWSSRFLSDRR